MSAHQTGWIRLDGGRGVGLFPLIHPLPPLARSQPKVAPNPLPNQPETYLHYCLHLPRFSAALPYTGTKRPPVIHDRVPQPTPSYFAPCAPSAAMNKGALAATTVAAAPTSAKAAWGETWSSSHPPAAKMLARGTTTGEGRAEDEGVATELAAAGPLAPLAGQAVAGPPAPLLAPV